MDFSPAALRAAQLALETAGHLSASVHMVNVWQPPQLLRTDVMLWVDDEEVPLVRHAEAAAEKRFAEALAQLDTGSVPVTTRFAVGHAADVLTEESDVPGTELICLGTHGTSFLERALVGSVASQVIRRAHCPVLTVRDSWAAPGSH
jgi:nucleotide-binding universal stress UspA family protein